VVRIAGEARYSLGDGKWHPLVAGKILTAGAIIQTGHDATVDIILGKKILMPQAEPTPDRVSLAADSDVRGYVSYKPSAEQNAVRLTSDTMLAIDKLTVSDTGVDTVSDTELDLQNGRIFYSVKKLSPESKYLIKFPNGIAGVRGSQGFMTVINGALGPCGALVHPLWITVTSPGMPPNTIVVDQGNEYDPGTGQQPAPMSPELLSLLKDIAIAAGSSYYELVAYSADHITIFVSPTTGARANGGSGSQGGGGEGPVTLAAH